MEQGARTERLWGAKTAGERRAERRMMIMTAGIRLFGRVGYGHASVKAVCEASGLTERYFYESFANSEDLLCRCFEQVTGDLLARMRDAAADDGRPPLACVHAALLVYFAELRDKPAAARVFLIEMASVSPATESLVSASLDAFGAVLVEVLRRDPAFDSVVSPLLLRGVVGGGLHIAQAWIRGGCLEDVRGVADTALRLYSVLVSGSQTGRQAVLF